MDKQYEASMQVTSQDPQKSVSSMIFLFVGGVVVEAPEETSATLRVTSALLPSTCKIEGPLGTIFAFTEDAL